MTTGDGAEKRTTPAQQAKAAMERARAGARARGVVARPASRAARDRVAVGGLAGMDPAPYGKGRDPRPVGDAVEAVVERHGWTERLDAAAIAGRWGEIVGEELAEHSEVTGFEDGALSIRASSTAWADQLRTMSRLLIARVNGAVGRELVGTVEIAGPTQPSWVKGPRRVKGRGPRDTYG